MKWGFLMTCFVVNFINIDGDCSQCDFGIAADYIPKKLNGLWHLDYTLPNYWNLYENVSTLLKLEGNVYDSLLEGNYVSTEETEFSGTWVINENDKTISVQYPTLPAFSTEYRMQATDNDSYFIFRGCPPGLNGTNYYVVWLRERCPSKCSVKEIMEAVEELGLDFSNFSKDPEIKKCCKSN